jgi:hypothetical protein
VKHNGVSIFLMPSGTIGTLRALWDVFPLFTNTIWGENANLNFLKKHMGATFKERSKPWVSEINSDDIHSGDFLVLSKIHGRWVVLKPWRSGLLELMQVILLFASGILMESFGLENLVMKMRRYWSLTIVL